MGGDGAEWGHPVKKGSPDGSRGEAFPQDRRDRGLWVGTVWTSEDWLVGVSASGLQDSAKLWCPICRMESKSFTGPRELGSENYPSSDHRLGRKGLHFIFQAPLKPPGF